MSPLAPRQRSFDQDLSLSSNDRDAESPQASRIMSSNDTRRGKHGIVGADMSSVFGRLLNCLHFFFAASVVEWADHNWLTQENISCR